MSGVGWVKMDYFKPVRRLWYLGCVIFCYAQYIYILSRLILLARGYHSTLYIVYIYIFKYLIDDWGRDEKERMMMKTAQPHLVLNKPT